MNAVHPVVLYLLEPADAGFAEGARYRVDQIDGDQFFFYTEEDAKAFMYIHGLQHINEDDMFAIRRAIKLNDDEDQSGDQAEPLDG